MSDKQNTIGPRTGYVPNEPIALLLEQWIKEQDDKFDTGSLGPRALLAIGAKVNPRRIYCIINRKSNWIDFNIADRILCYLGRTDYWIYDEQLAKAYEEVYLGGAFHSREYHAKIKHGICRACSVSFEYYVDFQDGKCCSARCASICGGRTRARDMAVAA